MRAGKANGQGPSGTPAPLPAGATFQSDTAQTHFGTMKPNGEKWSLVKLAGFLGLAPSTLRNVLDEHGQDGSKGYDVSGAIPVVVAHYRKSSERISALGVEAGTRKKLAEAEMAEIELEKKLGNIVSVDQARRIFESFRIQAREIVRVQDGMTLEQKIALCDKMAEINPFDE